MSIIDTQTNRLQRLVDDLLTFARIESGALRARPDPIAVALAVDVTPTRAPWSLESSYPHPSFQTGCALLERDAARQE